MMYVLGVIMAGGRGERLYPLTQHRAKPAVPFGGRYRIIDFVLSNFINSGILSIYVVTQFKAQSLLRASRPRLAHDRFSRRPFRYAGARADALGRRLVPRHRRLRLSEFISCSSATILSWSRCSGADHIYRMNVRQMIDEHQKKSADVTVAALPVRIEEASQFGVIKVDADWRITGFDEKPKNPKSIPGEPNYALVSMGNYLFNNEVLIASLNADAEKPASTHDFGRDILPGLIQTRQSLRLRLPQKPRADPVQRRRAELLARSGNDRCLLRSEHGFVLHRSVI